MNHVLKQWLGGIGHPDCTTTAAADIWTTISTIILLLLWNYSIGFKKSFWRNTSLIPDGNKHYFSGTPLFHQDVTYTHDMKTEATHQARLTLYIMRIPFRWFYDPNWIYKWSKLRQNDSTKLFSQSFTWVISVKRYLLQLWSCSKKPISSDYEKISPRAT